MKRPVLASSLARIVQLAFSSQTVRSVYRRPSLERCLNRIGYATFRLVRRRIFEADLNGVKILFYDPDSPENYWRNFFGGPLYEHSVIVHLRHVANQYDAPTFLDIGAHYGYFTVYMSKLGGPSSKVFSFEPNDEYFTVLKTNVRLNTLHNVVLHRVALSDKKEKVTLRVSQGFKLAGLTLERREMQPLGRFDSSLREPMTAIPFDELAEASKITPDIVKIDVHSAEPKVIAGMKKALRRHIEHLYCELHDGHSARSIVGMLKDAGMETFEFRGFKSIGGKLTEISEDIFTDPHIRMTHRSRMIYARK